MNLHACRFRLMSHTLSFRSALLLSFSSWLWFLLPAYSSMYVVSSSDPFLSFVRSFFRFIIHSRSVSCFINSSCLSLNLAYVLHFTEIIRLSLCVSKILSLIWHAFQIRPRPEFVVRGCFVQLLTYFKKNKRSGPKNIKFPLLMSAI